VQLLTSDNARLDENEVTIKVAGEGNLMYQVAGSYYLPGEVQSLLCYLRQLGAFA
jgi:hypothetical protein